MIKIFNFFIFLFGLLLFYTILDIDSKNNSNDNFNFVSDFNSESYINSLNKTSSKSFFSNSSFSFSDSLGDIHKTHTYNGYYLGK